MTGIVEPLVFVESADGRHFVFSQVEIEEINVLCESLLLRCLRDDCGTALNAPPQDDLGSGLLVLGCKVGQNLMGEDGVILCRHSELHVGRSSEVAEGHHLDFVFATVSVQFLNCVVWVGLYLEHGGLDFAVLQNLAKHGGSDVAAANVFHESLGDELFHGLIGLLVRDTSFKFHARLLSCGVVDPFRWVSCLDGNKLESDWEVNQVEVEVL